MKSIGALPLLLVLSAPGTGLAKGKLAGEAAGDAAYARACARDFARVIGRSAESGAERPAYDKAARLAERHARFQKIGEADNKEFIRIGTLANEGKETPAKLFFFSENAVLKELNDKVVADKDLVTALTNFRKDLEHFHLVQDPVLGPHIVTKYSDFKALQGGINTTDRVVVARLDEQIAKMNARYGEFLASEVAKRGWEPRASGLAKDPKRWFPAGLGVSPDEAALASRDARTLEVTGVPKLRTFLAARANLERAGRATELYQKWAAKRFAAVDGMLVDAGAGKFVLSAEAIEAMKKVTPATPTAEGYRDAVTAVLRERFGVEVSAKEADALKNYLAFADRFSPALLLEKRVEIDMGQAAAGVISADFKGQNARNLEETLKALARSEGMSLADRVKAVRAGERIATSKLEALKDRYARALSATVPGMVGQFSGDDGMGFLAKAFTDQDKLRFVRNWMKEGGSLGELRLTFEEFRYRDTGRSIPAEARSRLVVEAESVEKKLREKLLGPLDRRELNGTKILVSLEGAESGPARVHLLLLNEKGTKAGLAERARELTRELGFEVGRVEMRAP